MGKKPIPEKRTSAFPQPFLEAYKLRDAWFVVEGWKPQVSGGQSVFSLPQRCRHTLLTLLNTAPPGSHSCLCFSNTD